MEYILQCHLNPYYKSINPWDYKGLITIVHTNIVKPTIPHGFY